MAQKSSQIEELQSLQEQQSNKIEHLVSLVSAAAAKDPSDQPEVEPIITGGSSYVDHGMVNGDGGYNGVQLDTDPEQFLDWGDAGMMGLDGGLDELLKMGPMDGMEMDMGGAASGSPEAVASGETSIMGGKHVEVENAREEQEVEIHGGPGHGVKRRKVA